MSRGGQSNPKKYLSKLLYLTQNPLEVNVEIVKNIFALKTSRLSSKPRKYHHF